MIFWLVAVLAIGYSALQLVTSSASAIDVTWCCKVATDCKGEAKFCRDKPKHLAPCTDGKPNYCSTNPNPDPEEPIDEPAEPPIGGFTANP